MNWHEYFTYDEATGNLIWKHRPHSRMSCFNARFAGKVAGTIMRNDRDRTTAIRLVVNSRSTSGHCVVWEMHNGPVPDGLMIDHIDRNPLNNRLSNLRLATYEENNRNRGSFKHNKSGVKGVFWEAPRSLWKAVIYRGGRLILIGRFKDIEDARVARHNAEVKYFGEYRAA